MVMTAYYGLFRVSEIVEGPHVIKFIDVHANNDKNKILFVLWTSKTHKISRKSQVVKIMAVDAKESIWPTDSTSYCPCKVIMDYLKVRPSKNREKQLFIFRNGDPVKPEHFRLMLRKTITKLGLEAKLYNTYSFCIGRAKDLAKMGWSVKDIMKFG